MTRELVTPIDERRVRECEAVADLVHPPDGRVPGFVVCHVGFSSEGIPT